MLKRIAFCAMMSGALILSAPSFDATAQTDAPKPGDRAYTEMKISAFARAQAAYQQACGTDNLNKMDAAYTALGSASLGAVNAIADEVEARRDVRTASDNLNHLKLTYTSLLKQGQHADQEALTKAEIAYNNAESQYYKMHSDLYRKLESGLNVDTKYGRCPEHEEALVEKADGLRLLQEIKAEEAAQAAKAAAASAGAGASAAAGASANCVAQGGLAGVMEGVACQEQHAGSK